MFTDDYDGRLQSKLGLRFRSGFSVSSNGTYPRKNQAAFTGSSTLEQKQLQQKLCGKHVFGLLNDLFESRARA